MSRQEKKTRMRMLPPRVQLQQRDALTGSYPTVVRFSTDGRTGNYTVSYNDLQTIYFQTALSNSINLNDLQQYVIHYQRWNEEEFISDDGTNIYFKQTYVGTPYDVGQDTIIKNANTTGTPGSNNWYKGTSSYIWPTNIAPHKNLGSIYMNGASNRINNTYDYTDVDPNDDFTISMWIKPDSVSGETPLVRLSKNDTGAVGAMSWYFLIVDAQLACILVDAGSQFPIGPAYALAANLTNLINPNEWTHIAVTYSGGGSSGLKFYINGEPISSITGDTGVYTSMDSSNVSLIFGSRITGATEKYYSGYMSEFVYVGATLTDRQINDLYQLNKLGRKVYDKIDLGYAPGIGLPNTSNWLLQSNASDLEEILYSTIVTTTGSVVPGIIDNLPYIHFTPGQEMTPFRDSDQPAVDGKSTNNPFYATGSAISNVGEGFTSPLWSKNKIEIDISVAAPCSGTMFLSGVFFTGSLSAGTSNGNPIAPANTQGLSQEMMYYNFENKTWQGVGLGYPIGFLNRGLFGDAVGNLSDGRNPRLPYDNKIMMGFAPGIVNLIAGIDATQDSIFRTQVTGVFEWQASAGEPNTSFGFPYHPKFHATSSQLLNMSNYITEPFLLEKVVVELSAAYTLFGNTYNTASYEVAYGATPVPITSITQSTVPAAINNFFILNQRRPSNFNYQEQLLNDFTGKAILTTSLPTTIQLSPQGPSVYVDTIRDIITWGGVSSFASNITTNSFRAGAGVTEVVYGQLGTTVAPLSNDTKALMTRDCVFSSINEAHDDLTPLNWSGKVYMELPAKSPIKIGPEGEIENLFSFFTVGQNFNGLQSFWNLKYDGGGRNALGIVVPNARNYINPVAQVQTNGSFENAFNGGRENIFVISDNHYLYNPYILLPSDNLILGWQQPFLNVTYISGSSNVPNKFLNAKSGSFSEIKFLPGPAKVTLYGSYIREGREYNDGTNQLLSSDNVHEVIE